MKKKTVTHYTGLNPSEALLRFYVPKKKRTQNPVLKILVLKLKW